MVLLEGKKIVEEIYRDLAKRISRLKEQNRTPKIIVVMVGDDPVNFAYTEVKKAKAKQLGINFIFEHFISDIPQNELCENIVNLNRQKNICGIIIQLPLPKHFNWQRVLDCILPSLDIDGQTSINQGKLTGEGAQITPPTPAAIFTLLEYYKIDLKNQHVVLVGAGDLVGKPLSRLLMQKQITISVVTENTPDLSRITKTADVIISGVGKPNLISGKMVKRGAVVVDAGISFVEKQGKFLIHGDVDFKSVAKKAGYLTPVPGGVGPVTVAMLYKNLVNSCERNL